MGCTCCPPLADPLAFDPQQQNKIPKDERGYNHRVFRKWYEEALGHTVARRTQFGMLGNDFDTRLQKVRAPGVAVEAVSRLAGGCGVKGVSRVFACLQEERQVPSAARGSGAAGDDGSGDDDPQAKRVRKSVSNPALLTPADREAMAKMLAEQDAGVEESDGELEAPQAPAAALADAAPDAAPSSAGDAPAATSDGISPPEQMDVHS